MFDLGSVDVLRPVPVKGVESFDDGEAGSLDAALRGAFCAGVGFAGEELVQVFERPGLFLESLREESLVVLAHPGQFERL